MRIRVVVITLLGILLLTVGCFASGSSTPSPPKKSTSLAKSTATVKPVGKTITVPVDASHALNVEIPNVGQLSGPTGAFTRSGSITIQPVQASVPSSSIFQVSGAGMDMAFDGTSLRQPLALAFKTGKKPSADVFPLVAHQSDDGRWNYLPAKLDSSGRIIVQTSSFSPNIPIWGSASAFFHALGNFLASGIGGRTPPLPCPRDPSGAFQGPSWFHLDIQHSDMVHECMITKHTSGGQEVAEVQLKSNRGVTLEVDVPGNPAYVWVEGQTWPARQQVASVFHFDPNGKVLLLPGQTMTVGYTHQTGGPGIFHIYSGSAFAMLSSIIKDLTDTISEMIGMIPGPAFAYLALQFSLIQCGVSIDVNKFVPTISVSSFRSFLTCMVSTAFSQLKDDQTALNVAGQFGASKLDAAELVQLAKGFEIVGAIIAFWPFLQLSVGGFIDAIRGLISQEQTMTVTWQMDPPTTTNGGGGTPKKPPVTVTVITGTGDPNPSNPTVVLAQGPVNSSGEYRYAITLSGFPANATVSLECYDSVSPSGFYSFSLTTDSAGNGFTQSQCYSGDGPDHWVVANGITSNHVQWGGTTGPPPPPSPPVTYSETVGGNAHTWTDYTNAGGVQGPTIPAYQTVQIACKVTGFQVADGDTWWYRIASSPWSNTYYVSADAFYNNGATSGPLKGTPFVDPAVPNC